VQRRGAKTRRTVDVKVAHSAKEDRSDIKLRDAAAANALIERIAAPNGNRLSLEQPTIAIRRASPSQR
jgi:hypothetical protein